MYRCTNTHSDSYRVIYQIRNAQSGIAVGCPARFHVHGYAAHSKGLGIKWHGQHVSFSIWPWRQFSKIAVYQGLLPVSHPCVCPHSMPRASCHLLPFQMSWQSCRSAASNTLCDVQHNRALLDFETMYNV